MHVRVCVCVCICIYVHIQMWIGRFLATAFWWALNIDICTFTYRHTYRHIKIIIRVGSSILKSISSQYLWLWSLPLPVYAPACVCACVFVCVFVCVCVCMSRYGLVQCWSSILMSFSSQHMHLGGKMICWTYTDTINHPCTYSTIHLQNKHTHLHTTNMHAHMHLEQIC